MSTPSNDAEALGDSPLVEPVAAPMSADPLESLDTARILNETVAIPVIGNDQDSDSAQPADSITEEVAPEATLQGWNILSIVSLILALVASPLAVVFGYLAVGQVRRSAQRGEPLAWVAVGLGWVWAVAYVVAGAVLALTWFQVA